jgi:hypothetical protein
MAFDPVKGRDALRAGGDKGSSTSDYDPDMKLGEQ